MINHGTTTLLEAPFVQGELSSPEIVFGIIGGGVYFPSKTERGIVFCFPVFSKSAESPGTAMNVFLHAGQSTSFPSYSSDIVKRVEQNGQVILIISFLSYYPSILVLCQKVTENLFPCLFLGSSEMGLEETRKEARMRARLARAVLEKFPTIQKNDNLQISKVVYDCFTSKFC
jgi:hypothetical protein